MLSKIGPLTVALASLEYLKSPHRFLIAQRSRSLPFGLLVSRVFLGCEELVPNFHICEESVTI